MKIDFCHPPLAYFRKTRGVTSKKNPVHSNVGKKSGLGVCVCVWLLVYISVAPWWIFTLMSLHINYKLIEIRYDKWFHISKAYRFIKHLAMKAVCVQMCFGTHGHIYQEPSFGANRNVFFCGHCFDDRQLCPFYGKVQCLPVGWRNVYREEKYVLSMSQKKHWGFPGIVMQCKLLSMTFSQKLLM